MRRSPAAKETPPTSISSAPNLPFGSNQLPRGGVQALDLDVSLRHHQGVLAFGVGAPPVLDHRHTALLGVPGDRDPLGGSVETQGLPALPLADQLRRVAVELVLWRITSYRWTGSVRSAIAENNPPASIGPSCSGSPTRTSFAPASARTVAVHGQEHCRCTASVDRVWRSARLGAPQSVQWASATNRRERA